MIDLQLIVVLIKVVFFGKNNINLDIKCSYNFGWLFVNIFCLYWDCVNYIYVYDLLKLLFVFFFIYIIYLIFFLNIKYN